MKRGHLLLLIPVGFLVILISCKSGMEADAGKIADIMCRSKEITEKVTLEATKPVVDSLKIRQLQAEAEKIQQEMNVVYAAFNKKYEEKIGDKSFESEFRKALNRAILKCPHLSEEDKKLLKEGAGN